MQNSAAKIQCSNPNCQADNSLDNKSCHKCRTPIVKRYLWALGEQIKAYQIGELIDDRYLLKEERIVLDTKPGLVPEVPEEVPSNVLPYLQLFPYQLHIPQIYGQIFGSTNQSGKGIWLLEYGTVPVDNLEELKYPELLPQLTQLWEEATPLRQLNWLWQIARLWQPLHSKGLASSLLNPSLLRVNGSIVQLLELQSDPQPALNLKHLGQLWSDWVASSSPSISDFLQQLCQQIETSEITNSEQLIVILDRALLDCGLSQQRRYTIYTLTDSGPSRKHNEDACYPANAQQIKHNSSDKVLAIVCDGIGGHASGEIASQLAIDSLVENIEQLTLEPNEPNPTNTILKLEDFACAANDIISERNDSEQRQERQRMGTTLAMTLAHDHEVYFTHVGDSRIYWITASGCRQLTVDDDLASREVQLGYAFYRDAVQYPNGGALIQALGMEPSANLHPTVDRLVLDEDCVFLLCSDGLSDYDRVEQYWASEVLPILQGKTDVEKAGKRLLEIANRKNGHDNVTVALVHCQVSSLPKEEDTDISFSDIKSSITASLASSDSKTTLEEPCVEKTNARKPQPLVATSSLQHLWTFLLTVSILLGLGVFSYQKIPQFKIKVQQLIENLLTFVGLDSAILSPVANSKSNSPVFETVEIEHEIALWSISKEQASEFSHVGNLAEGTTLQVLQQTPDSNWLLLKVCQVPANNNLGLDREQIEALLKKGHQLWIEAKDIERLIEPQTSSTSDDLAVKCSASN
ncbi:MAG: PP2C family serine/threonine-protein phosphatase [Prochloraceae cyanobacterium]